MIMDWRFPHKLQKYKYYNVASLHVDWNWSHTDSRDLILFPQ